VVIVLVFFGDSWAPIGAFVMGGEKEGETVETLCEDIAA
jgi:hypothetical protein